jgi:electron transfer flavoprotein alpha subunit
LNPLPRSLEGITGVLHSSSEAYANNLAETITFLLASILERSEYTHVVSSHSSNSKNIIPRLSGVLDIPAVSDVMSVSHSPSDNTTTFTRPIYAGNAIATIKAPGSLHTKIFTVRSTAFEKAPSSPHSSAKVEAVEPISLSDVPTTHLETIIAKSNRPELGTAARVVSGGRALKNAATFKETLDPLADALGAAVGASRAAVDAGYADNSLQVIWVMPHSPLVHIRQSLIPIHRHPGRTDREGGCA